MKILIVDDDQTTRALLTGVLERWGYEVCTAATGQEAWQHFLEPDSALLAIIDWIMPGMSGLELCRKIKAHVRSRIPYLILLTARGERQDLVQGLNAGADDFMVKPWHPDELRARLTAGRRVLGLQQELRDTNERLEQRVRQRTQQVERLLDQREELLHHLAHDLRTPLTPLLALLPLLEQTETDPERQQMLESVLAGARNIQTIAGRILEFCRVDGQELVLTAEGANLRALAGAVLRQCALIRPAGNRTILNEVPESVRVYADASQLRQVLAQLIDNAMKFTREDGHIVVRAVPGPGTVIVAVADDGIGLGGQELARLFEPFFKADASRHHRTSPGLGLAIAKAMIEKHGGRMWAESPGPDRGATFHFSLPRIAGASPASPEPSRGDQAPAEPALTVAAACGEPYL